jgi:2-hydroxy-3-keto-5-methylthiopentenyl-1-phosphate phosphatase
MQGQNRPIYLDGITDFSRNAFLGTMRSAFLFDFDGTMTIRDTSELVLRRFAKGDWERYDRMMDRGQMTLEQCMKEQFKLVNERPSEILTYLDGVVEGRKGFLDLASELKRADRKIVVVSTGLDFVIANYLRSLRMFDQIDVVSGKTWHDGYIHFEFPPIRNDPAVDFKQDVVMEFKKKFQMIVYTGDGSSDYNAARSSDFVFTVRSSRLENYCIQNNIRHEAFDDFNEVIPAMAKFIY